MFATLSGLLRKPPHIINIDNVFLSSPDIAVYEGIIKARLEFINSTRLVVEILLQVTADHEIYEERYYYGYYSSGRRIFAEACPELAKEQSTSSHSY